MDTDEKNVAGERPSTSDRPKLLYKYLDRHGLDAIAKLELRVTPPNEFNDPFEFIPRFVAETEDDWQAYYEISKRQTGFPSITYQQFRQSYSISRNAAAVQREFQNLSSRYFLVLCLSANPQSVTQWGYYAAGHSGLVLELRMTEHPFPPLIDNKLLVPVRYCCADERKAQSIHRVVNTGGIGEMERLLFDTAGEKSKEWSEEEEYRLLVPRDQQMSFLRSRFVRGRLIYFLKFGAEAIGRLILGAKASVKFEQKVRKAAAVRGIPNDRVTRASIDLENYCVRA